MSGYPGISRYKAGYGRVSLSQMEDRATRVAATPGPGGARLPFQSPADGDCLGVDPEASLASAGDSESPSSGRHAALESLVSFVLGHRRDDIDHFRGRGRERPRGCCQRAKVAASSPGHRRPTPRGWHRPSGGLGVSDQADGAVAERDDPHD